MSKPRLLYKLRFSFACARSHKFDRPISNYLTDFPSPLIISNLRTQKQKGGFMNGFSIVAISMYK